MEALRKVYDDATDEILVPVPPEWRHRRIEVVLSALDGCEEPGVRRHASLPRRHGAPSRHWGPGFAP